MNKTSVMLAGVAVCLSATAAIAQESQTRTLRPRAFHAESDDPEIFTNTPHLDGVFPIQEPPSIKLASHTSGPFSAVPPAPGVSVDSVPPVAAGTGEYDALKARLDQLEAEVQHLREQPVGFTSGAGSTPHAPIQATLQPSQVFHETGWFGLDPLGSHFSGTPAGMGSPAPPAPTRPGTCPADMPPPKFTSPLGAKWGTSPGFQLQTEDGDFTLQMHNLTQFDFRTYNHTANIPNNLVADVPGASGPNDTFTFPRVWLIFNGTLTKNWEWMLAPSFQFDNVNLLDAWINMHYDDRLQVKAGRYKTPFTYEFYAEPIQGLINPERSLFFNNFGLNRQVGIMAHGTVLDQYMDYAIGVYNGQRNGFVSNTNSKDVVGYINIRPFMNSEYDWLRRIDVGGSFDVGNEDNPPGPGSPTVLRTSVATNGNMVNGIEFLQLLPTVREQGLRALGSVHAAYYYQHLSLIAELQGGGEHYGNLATSTNSQIPITSWYVQSGYFLTGETTTYRNTVKPLHPFTLKGGTGAIELTGRFNNLDINKRIFTDGLVDTTGGNQWTNRVDMLDLGVNWYPNQWLKVAAIWEHCWFGSPVTYRPGKASSTNDMFLIRTQIWF